MTDEPHPKPTRRPTPEGVLDVSGELWGSGPAELEPLCPADPIERIAKVLTLVPSPGDG